MKLYIFLILAIFASCEAITKLEKIAQETHSRLISNVPARRAFGARINTKEGPDTENGGGASGNPQDPTTTEEATEKPTECDPSQFKCINDELIFCDPITLDTVNISCSSALGSTGYCNCDGDSCQASPPTNCPGTPAPSKCKNNDEFLPSATNCKQFSFCDQGDLFYYECDANLVYDPNAKNCVVGNCRTARCPTNQAASPVYVAFAQPNDNFYILCYRGKFTVGKCLDGLTAQSSGCSFKCKGVGNFADPKRPNSEYYYSCTGYYPNYRRTSKQCPVTGFIFDQQLRVCRKKRADDSKNSSA